jgi:deazaflavin-dependent oxidoreductase (nitroreductase family)
MRPLTKVLNPVIAKLAGRRHMGMAATVSHTGRRTGRTHNTSVGARLAGNVFVIPLTFGTRSDWCRNLVAAGGGQIRLKARTYDVSSPLMFAWRDDRPLVKAAFPAAMRPMLKVLGIKTFIRLDIVSKGSSSDQPLGNGSPARSG